MKKLIILTTICFAVITTVAQEQADIEVSYNYKHFHRTGKEQNHQMILLANAVSSKFFNPETEYVDSLEYTPDGKEIYNQMKMAAFTSGNMKSVPQRRVPMYIFKSKERGETDVYDGINVMMFRFTEPYGIQNWEISDSTKNILGYECTMATCDWRGRHWTAWFSPEIPIQDGPWKLSGLPGLILEASENSGQHVFSATGVQMTPRQITPVLNENNYEKTDRMTMLKVLRKFEDNPEAGLSTALGIGITVKDGIKFDKTLDFLETDYR
ncbi:GLPGLI family protein [Lepagella muris]|jgi:GLPGLI family protein|uniref:GLPGLI family protein n=1 Tax=Lepagella muris TaxID=3032870 RepID=A0AC61RK40_9BACT|nr:GLPGLI family protein [Lepagella muris]TGY78465.1 GLPGLI family protein [Lepagella muris]THG53677.1 GLPGLI family protein [Bacteroidales bacterium]TKC66118.1 GLPGLI family protein [Bacteroidales bacterium]